MYGLLKTLLPSLNWRFKTDEKVIYLTFDDGPSKELTPFILNELEKYSAKATFFLTGKNVLNHFSTYKQIIKQGHKIGNHTYSHLNGWKCKNQMYFSDIKKCNDLLETELFRPPYGKIKPSQIKYLKNKYNIIMWDVLSWDFNQKITPQKCLDIVLKKTKRGSIIVFHDNEKSITNLKFTLPKVLDYFHSKGYKFKTVNN